MLFLSTKKHHVCDVVLEWVDRGRSAGALRSTVVRHPDAGTSQADE